jgi:hypothetical protein
MQDFELQLLARLVNGFPAGNISIILLINSAGNYQSKVDAFGKNLLKWEVETEAGEAKQKLTDWVATEPEPSVVPSKIEPTFLSDAPTLSDEVVPVSKLLNLPTKTAWRVPGFGKKDEPAKTSEPLPAFVPPVIPVPTPAPSIVSPAAPVAAAPLTDTTREPELRAPALAAAGAGDADLFKRQPRKSRAGWVLLVLFMSTAVFGVMNKDWVLEEAELLKKYLLRGTPAVAAPEEAASAAAAASAASADALAAAEQAASVASQAALVASQAESVASAASAAASTASAAASAAVAPAAPVASEPVAVASADVPVKKKTEVKPEAGSDEAWVNQLPASGYVVQLAAMDTQEDMRSFQRSNAAYAKARILRARHKDNGKRYYILVAGPFETKAQADAFMQSSPLLAKGWLRSTKSMAAQFTKS